MSDNTIIVKFKPGAPRDSEPRRQAAAAVNGRIAWQGRALHEFAVIHVPRGTSVLARAAAAGLPQVQYAALDYYGQFAGVQQGCPPNDPLYPQQWYLKNIGQTIAQVPGVAGADIRMEQAWCVPPYGEVSPNIVIAVIDRGVAYIPQVAPNLWVNPGEGPIPDGQDNDGNGIIDDIHGAAFLPGPNFPDDDCCGGQPQGNPEECGFEFEEWHGTPIAALIGAVGNDGASIAGVSWSCRIMAVRLMMTGQPGWPCEGQESSFLDAIDYAVTKGAKVLNCSWGVPRVWPPSFIDDPIHDAVLRVGEHGVLAVFAAHNQGWNLDEPWVHQRYWSPQYFNTEFDNMIVVGATDHRDWYVKATVDGPWQWSSNYGQRVDVAAPGVFLRVPDDSREGGYFGGTSGATPLVASVAAQVWTVNPTFTPQQVINRILCTVRVPAPAVPWPPTRTGGVLDAHAALTGTCP